MTDRLADGLGHKEVSLPINEKTKCRRDFDMGCSIVQFFFFGVLFEKGKIPK